MYFYGCEDGANCTSIQFYMGIELDHTVSLERINDWNRDKRFGTAVFDTDGYPYLKMDLNLDFGGITAPAFEDNLDLWERLVAEFSDYVTADKTDAPQMETAPKPGPLQEL
ncbi:YbjN domain-containing protein [Pseudorhodobacter ferrugineus]|uniref:YbjN domain-containing protein n=1 Tax=Pseudorhodobacter ferrugineus TaxID=77008 RepID=UPI0009DBD60A|nr:YbjN domain-containing protein [Pseudorhodobacter ferrugineus]